MRRWLPAWGALLSLLGPAASAGAYCRTSTCSTCSRDAETGCTRGGTPLAWANQCVSFSMEESAAASVELETARALMLEAFATWQNVRCPPDDLPPSIHVSHAFGSASCAEPEYNAVLGNANVVMFREDRWPYASEGNALAATRVKFDPKTGDIYDADMEINALLPLLVEPEQEQEASASRIDLRVEKGIVPGGYDLLSIMTHEAGHFLGLDHSSDPDAVMRPLLRDREVVTTLNADDVAAICEAYPPERDAPACDPTPRGGFAAQCAKRAPVRSTCSLAPTRGGGWQESLLTLFAGLGLVLCRRSRRVRR